MDFLKKVSASVLAVLLCATKASAGYTSTVRFAPRGLPIQQSLAQTNVRFLSYSGRLIRPMGQAAGLAGFTPPLGTSGVYSTLIPESQPATLSVTTIPKDLVAAAATAEPRSFLAAESEDWSQSHAPGALGTLNSLVGGILRILNPRPLLNRAFDRVPLVVGSSETPVPTALHHDNMPMPILLSGHAINRGSNPKTSLIENSPVPPVPSLPWAWALAAVGLIAATALFGQGSFVSHVIPFAPLFLGMMVPAGSGKGDSREDWIRRFQARLKNPVAPGDAFNADLGLNKHLLVRQGLENGYLLQLSRAYLYAVPQEIGLAAESSNRQLAHLIETGVRHHGKSQFAAALAYFAKAEDLLQRIATQAKLHGADAQAWQTNGSLVGLLMNNTLSDLYYEHLAKHPRQVLTELEQHALRGTLSQMVFAHNREWKFPPAGLSRDVSLGALKQLATQVAADLKLPENIDTPVDRQVVASLINTFAENLGKNTSPAADADAQDPRTQWEKKFQESFKITLMPGEALDLKDVGEDENGLLLQGFEQGYLFRPWFPTDRFLALYALPAEIQSAGALSSRFSNLIAQGVRAHAKGEAYAALATFLAAQKVLDEIEQSGSTKIKSDQRAYALNYKLAELLIWNTMPDLIRALIRKLKISLLSQEAQATLDLVLDSYFLALNREADIPFEAGKKARSTLQSLAGGVKRSLDWELPDKLDSPWMRQVLSEKIDQFVSMVTTEGSKTIGRSPKLSDVSTPLSDAYAQEIKDLSSSDSVRRKAASDVLGQQTKLSPAVLQALTEVMRSGDLDARYRAASFLATDDPQNEEAQRLSAEGLSMAATFSSLKDTLRAMLGLSVIQDRWAMPVRFTPREIVNLALRSAEGASEKFRTFLQRVLEYTNSPRRFMKVLLEALQGSSPDAWAYSMIAPKSQHTFDMLWKAEMERRLSRLIPKIIQTLEIILGKRGNLSNNIVGIMVVGGVADHPTDGSGLDYLIVTKHGEGLPMDIVLNVLRTLVPQYTIFQTLSSLTFQGVIRFGSLDFKRELALGSFFIGVNGQIIK